MTIVLGGLSIITGVYESNPTRASGVVREIQIPSNPTRSRPDGGVGRGDATHVVHSSLRLHGDHSKAPGPLELPEKAPEFQTQITKEQRQGPGKEVQRGGGRVGSPRGESGVKRDEVVQELLERVLRAWSYWRRFWSSRCRRQRVRLAPRSLGSKGGRPGVARCQVIEEPTNVGKACKFAS